MLPYRDRPVMASGGEVYIPGSPAMVARARRANCLKRLLGAGLVQNFMKRRIEKTLKGPSAAKREARPTFVWGEVANARGDKRAARIKTPTATT
jgi:short subunit dehydrogenase-like uncharacterized protein